MIKGVSYRRWAELKKDFARIHFARLSNFQYSISGIGFKILNFSYEFFFLHFHSFDLTLAPCDPKLKEN